MSEDSLRYDKMVEDALRGVVRDALAATERDGLLGDHHFYITFRTRYPGVHLSPVLMARHPDEMTIVLQHQFWGLEVEDHAFQVTLSFGGVSERLYIPLAAITGFADPSAKFGLQFQVDEALEAPAPSAGAPASAVPAKSAPAAAETAESTDGKVVALDAFRKK
jgi:hypothetical protein